MHYICTLDIIKSTMSTTIVNGNVREPESQVKSVVVVIMVIESGEVKLVLHFHQAFSIFNADLRPAILLLWVLFVWTFIWN